MSHSNIIAICLLFCSGIVSANWKKINDADYSWGPFTIYNITLFSEDGRYTPNTRPLMLTLKYAKPVDGRDFAISLARSWSNLGITLPEQDDIVDRLRKIIPNIKKDDLLSYIALKEKGYFILNDTVIPEEFNQDFNDAVLAIWLDPRVEIGRKLLINQPTPEQLDLIRHSELEKEKEKAEETKNEQKKESQLERLEWDIPEMEIIPNADPQPFIPHASRLKLTN
ncbi:hypothetical protein EV693_102290 [Nicoletella semolina]|uniref:Chalcone isomerase-like protein n=1 Tax=Nicoletella semolina TaxID=271160 RepID=A0A4R2NBZ9_9PAST|nr:chalcone isomerase family protein [Nicoletella semolina]TCP18610.1 hypothetical protein EV693_102290 [Nicoletella semolina]